MSNIKANAVDAYHEHLNASAPHLPGGRPVLPEDFEGPLRRAARESGVPVEDLRRWVQEAGR